MELLTKILLFPFAVIYGMVIGIRNGLYKTNFIGSTDFEIPVISVGNLSMGGTGKTPFIELLIELLHGHYHTGVLSRGYKRKTTGFLEVLPELTALETGDEPLMLKLKYPSVKIAVGEQRVIAIPQLLAKHPEVQVILLDDAFQHQSVRPDINILLTAYNRPFYNDYILPMGTLREFTSGKSRANIIVVTKCPPDISQEEQEQIRAHIQPAANQRVFFSTIEYGAPYNILNPLDILSFDTSKAHLLITGIAQANPLKAYLQGRIKEVIHFEFNDHHVFSKHELENIQKYYPDFNCWLTTEKDGVRLALHREWLQEHNISLYCLPIKTKLIGDHSAEFLAIIRGFLAYFYTTESQIPKDIRLQDCPEYLKE